MEVQRKRKYLTGKRGEKSPRKKMSSEQRGKREGWKKGKCTRRRRRRSWLIIWRCFKWRKRESYSTAGKSGLSQLRWSLGGFFFSLQVLPFDLFFFSLSLSLSEQRSLISSLPLFTQKKTQSRLIFSGEGKKIQGVKKKTRGCQVVDLLERLLSTPTDWLGIKWTRTNKRAVKKSASLFCQCFFSSSTAIEDGGLAGIKVGRHAPWKN